jgi:hypothetical protein
LCLTGHFEEENENPLKQTSSLDQYKRGGKYKDCVTRGKEWQEQLQAITNQLLPHTM